MSYAQPPNPSATAEKQPSYVASVLMIVFGALLIPGGVIVGMIIGFMSVAAGLTDYVNSAQYLFGPTEVEMVAGEHATIVDDTSWYDDPVTCTVTGPNGAISLESLTTSKSVSGRTYEGLYSFDADAAGTYLVDCGDASVELVPWDGPLPGYAITGGIVAVVVSIALPIAGVVLLIVGIVKCVRVSNKRKALFPPPGGYPPGGYPPGFYSQVPGDPRQPPTYPYR